MRKKKKTCKKCRYARKLVEHGEVYCRDHKEFRRDPCPQYIWKGWVFFVSYYQKKQTVN